MSRSTNGRPQTGVVSESLRGKVVVRLDAGALVKARTRLSRRRLRPGDRVMVDGGSVTPLFAGLRGSVEHIDERGLTIGGRHLALDEHSVVRYGHGDSRPAAHGGLRTGTYVGALCVENRIERTLTVQALFVGG
jgi:hypothetical protein